MTAARAAGSALFLVGHWAYAAFVLAPWLLLRRRQARCATPAQVLAPALDRPGVAEFDRLARIYDVVSWPLTAPLFEAARPIVEPRLPPDGEVLDLACGPGRELRSLARLVPKGGAVGVDLAPGMLALAQRRMQRTGRDNWQLLQDDGEALPDELSGRFDLVHCSLAHHHFARPDLVAASVLRCLRPGGTYAIVDAVRPWLTAPLAPLSRWVDPGFQQFHSPHQLASLLRDAGFANVEVEPLSPGFAVVLATAPNASGH